MPAPENSALNNILAKVGGDEGALLQQRQKLTDQTAANVQGGMDQRHAIVGRMRENTFPDDPNLRDVSGVPPQPPSIEPLKAFQNPGVVLAMFGSLMTRAPLTAAFKAGGAAMKAYSEGNMREYEMQRQHWQDNLDAALRQNEIELHKYNAKIQRFTGNQSELAAEMQGVGAENQDQITLNALTAGSIDLTMSTLRHREDAAMKLRTIALANDIKRQSADLAERKFADQQKRTDGYLKNLDSLGQYRETQGQLAEQRVELAKGQLQARVEENAFKKLKNADELRMLDARIAEMKGRGDARTQTLQIYRDRLQLDKDKYAQHDREFKITGDRYDKSLNERIRADKAREALAAGKGLGKVTAAVNDLQALVKQVEALDQMVERNPGLVGLQGYGQRHIQNITGQSPLNWNTYPEATDFENKLHQFQTQLTKPFLEAHYFTKNSNDAIDELLPAMDPGKGVQTVRSAFGNMKTLLTEKIAAIQQQNTDFANAANQTQLPPPPDEAPDYSEKSTEDLMKVLQEQ